MSEATTKSIKPTIKHEVPFFLKLKCFIAGNLIIGAVAAIIITSIVGLFRMNPYVLVAITLYYSYICTVGSYEYKDGKPWPAFSRNYFVFNLFRKYHDLEIQETVPEKIKNSKQQLLFAVFPHGANADFRVLMEGMLHDLIGGPEGESNIRTLVSNVLFRLPIVRAIVLWTGCVDASRTVAEKCLDRGRSILVLPGGEQEQIRTKYGKELVFLMKRKGFIKLAMKKGVSIVPTYVFGVNDLYYTSHIFFGPRVALIKAAGICLTLAWGMWGSMFCPLPTKMTIVLGEPISFDAKDKNAITSEELDDAHKKFCKALKDLFDKHKEPLGYGDRSLEIL